MRIGVNALQMRSAGSKAGLSRYAFRLLEAVIAQRHNHEITVFTHETFEAPSSWKGVPGFSIAPARGKLGRMPHIWGSVVASFASRKFDAWLSLAHTVPLWGRTPSVLVVHDLFSITDPQLYVSRRGRITAGSLRRSIPRANRLIAVSEDTKSGIIETFSIDPARIEVIHLGPGNEVTPVDPHTVSEERLREIGVPYKRYLFMLSTVEPRKNVPRLIEAFARVASAPGHEDLGLVIGGGKGWESSDVYCLPEKFGVGGRVTFLGYVKDEDLPALFARCEAYVLPSLSEGFGMTVLEAMLAGAPVACSRSGALTEVGGDAAMYFDPTNLDDVMAVLLRRIRSDRSEAVRKGLEQARKFSWEQTAARTLLVVEQAASQDRKS